MTKTGVLEDAPLEDQDGSSRSEMYYLGVSAFERVSCGKHLVLTGLLTSFFAGWFAIAALEGNVSGTGHIVSTNTGHVIRAHQAGKLNELYVTEGQEVRAGQILLSLDDLRIRADYEILRGKELANRASISRLRAELLNEASPIFDSEIVAHDSAIAEREQKLFAKRKQNYAEAMMNFDLRLAFAQNTIHSTQPHAKGGLINVVSQIRKSQDVIDLEEERARFVTAHREGITSQLGQLSAERQSLIAMLEKKRSQLWGSIIVSPVRGRIKNLRTMTSGTAIQPYQKVMEIVPIDHSFIIEAQIPSDQIQYISPDMTAKVNLYPHGCVFWKKINGSVLGIETGLAARPRQQGSSFRTVRIIAKMPPSSQSKTVPPIETGMVVNVDIQTPRKTAVSTLVRPFSMNQKLSCFG